MKDSDHREKTVSSGTGRGSRKEAVSTMGWLQAGSPQLGPQWTNTMGTWNRCCRCLPLGWATLSSRQIYLWLSCFCSQSVSRAMLTDWLGLGRLVQNPSVLFAWEGLRIANILWVCSLTVKQKNWCWLLGPLFLYQWQMFFIQCVLTHSPQSQELSKEITSIFNYCAYKDSEVY